MARPPILGLDVGSNTVRAVVAEPTTRGQMVVKQVISRRSRGLRRGVVVETNEVADTLREVFTEVAKVSKPALRNIYLGVNGADVRTQSSRGIIAVSRANSEIYQDDIDRVIQASGAVNSSSNRVTLHTLTKEFVVDGINGVNNPLGMVGARLEVVSYLVEAFEPAVKSLMHCVELNRGSVSALILNPLAAAQAVLNKSQKELGVVLADIGYNTTGLAVYEEDKLLHTKVLGVGAGHITSDLAVALKVPVEAAEKIKIDHGFALASGVQAKETIDLSQVDQTLKGNPSRRFVAEVIESRLAEICELINDELKSIGKEGHLPGGAVLVGGGAKMPGIVELFRNDLKLSTKVGYAGAEKFGTISPNIADVLENPEYATVLGLAFWDRELNKDSVSQIKSGLVSRIVKIFLP
ncbi:MAG: cell division protein FtsA [Patescibacteria group bacterium]|nr:cell division protein FtsA [Patescibacteria group bacterium]